MKVNGNVDSGQGFVIAADKDKIFQVPLALWTDKEGPLEVSLYSEGEGNIVFSQREVTITRNETVVSIHATAKSMSRNDTVLLVIGGNKVLKSFHITSIIQPEIWFRGRFQVRFATDNDPYNEKRGTSKGWNFTLECEPDFVPDGNTVVTDINKPVGREIRFNEPVALRSHVPPIGVRIVAIKGKTGTGTEVFGYGDPIIGKKVDLGPHTYFASNLPPKDGDPLPKEYYSPGFEPMALFEFRIENAFSGKSRSPEDRPKAEGLELLTGKEIEQYCIFINHDKLPSSTFDKIRKDTLLIDYRSLSTEDRINSIEGRNLATRIAHLGGDREENIAPLNRTLQNGWIGKEEFQGVINDSISFENIESSVMEYYRHSDSFKFFARMFNYHSDEQCGQVHGCMTISELPQRVNNLRLERV